MNAVSYPVITDYQISASLAWQYPAQHLTVGTPEIVRWPANNANVVMMNWGALRAKLSKWADLEPGWDGDDGIAPDPAVVDSGKAFLDLARAAGLPLPQSYIAGDGEFGFRWRGPAYYSSVSFLDDGHIVGYVEANDAVVFRIDEKFSEVADVTGLLKSLNSTVARV